MIGACVAFAERSLLAITKGAWDLAERYLAEARAVARAANLEDYPPVTILYAVAARMALHEADPPRAREELTRAQRLRPGRPTPCRAWPSRRGSSWRGATWRCSTPRRRGPCSGRPAQLKIA